MRNVAVPDKYSGPKQSRKLSADQIAWMRERWAAGERQLDLAVDLDVSETTIYWYTRGVERVPRVRERRVDPAEAIALRSSGIARREVARRFGVSPQVLSSTLSRYRRSLQLGAA